MELSDLHIEKVKRDVARPFIMENHYTGTCNYGPMSWGLFNGDELVGAIAFATPISEAVRKSIWKDEFEEEMKDRTTELHRLYTKDETPHNTESWFVSRAIKRLKEYKPKHCAVISFADRTEGHQGTVYQAVNAIYYGMTGEATYYRTPDGRLKAPRYDGKNISVAEARSRGWETEKRKSKHRYLFLLPDKDMRKSEIQNRLDIEEQEYPK
jgi:hypothetical protein